MDTNISWIKVWNYDISNFLKIITWHSGTAPQIKCRNPNVIGWWPVSKLRCLSSLSLGCCSNHLIDIKFWIFLSLSSSFAAGVSLIICNCSITAFSTVSIDFKGFCGGVRNSKFSSFVDYVLNDRVQHITNIKLRNAAVEISCLLNRALTGVTGLASNAWIQKI